MSKNPPEKINITIFFILLATLFMFWIFFGLSSYALLPLLIDKDMTALGQFGDMFGAANSLFSAFAFAGVIYTILLQRTELQLQRQELEDTRAEIRGQKEQLQAQNSTMRRQVFESSFFALLGAYQDNIKLLDIRSNKDHSVIRQGKDCFEYFFSSALKNAFRHLLSGGTSLANPELDLRIIRILGQPEYSELTISRGGIDRNATYAYVYFFLKHQADVGHYFRTVYHLIRFVDESDLLDSEKRQFCRILRAQMSTYELLLFFYNGISPYGYKKFWPLANKYSFFQNLDTDLLLDQNHVKYYQGALD